MQRRKGSIPSSISILRNIIHKRLSPESARTSKQRLEEGSTDNTLSYYNALEQKRQEEGLLEPAKLAAPCLVDNVLKNRAFAQEKIYAADIDCGDHQFANFLQTEVEKHEELKSKIFQSRIS